MARGGGGSGRGVVVVVRWFVVRWLVTGWLVVGDGPWRRRQWSGSGGRGRGPCVMCWLVVDCWLFVGCLLAVCCSFKVVGCRSWCCFGCSACLYMQTGRSFGAPSMSFR